MPGKPAGATWVAEPKVVERLDYRQDYSGYSDAGHSQLFVVPASGGTPRQLTSGPWNHSAPVWSTDGKELLFSSLRVKDAEYEWRETEIYAVNVASGAVRQLTTRKGPDFGPQASPDGKLVAYSGYDWTDDTYITNHLYVMNVDGSNRGRSRWGSIARPKASRGRATAAASTSARRAKAGATSTSRR